MVHLQLFCVHGYITYRHTVFPLLLKSNRVLGKRHKPEVGEAVTRSIITQLGIGRFLAYLGGEEKR